MDASCRRAARVKICAASPSMCLPFVLFFVCSCPTSSAFFPHFSFVSAFLSPFPPFPACISLFPLSPTYPYFFLSCQPISSFLPHNSARFVLRMSASFRFAFFLLLFSHSCSTTCSSCFSCHFSRDAICNENSRGRMTESE